MKNVAAITIQFLLVTALAIGSCVLAGAALAEGQGTDAATRDFLDKHYGAEDKASQDSEPANQGVQPKQGGDLTVSDIVEALTRPTVEDTDVAYQRPHVDLDIKFEFDSATLTDAGKQDLDVAAQALEHVQLRSSRFMLAGHTDSTGEETHNELLSLERARSARDYLVNERGIDSSRLETIGFGSRKPRAEGDTLEARRMNRRVVIELIQ